MELNSADIATIFAQVQDRTMVSQDAIRFTIEQTIHVIKEGIPGSLVECGVWRGGASLAMLLGQRLAFGTVLRPVYLFDSFAGLPLATERDGPLAMQWQRAVDSPEYYDNCRASIEDVRAGFEKFAFREEEYCLIEGWFADTMPRVKDVLGSQAIALLRLDGDWYDSTMTCLTYLMPHLVEEGIVIIDDYYAWDGCARAVHDYLSRNDLCYRIRSLPSFSCAYLIKRRCRNSPTVL